MITSLIRTFILYFIVIIALRFMGKRQIGDMQPGELVITILISQLASIPIQDATQPIIGGVLAIFTLVILEVTVSFLAMKIPIIRRMVSGKPAVIINGGKMDQKLMKQMRVTVSDLLEVLRSQGVFDVATVDYAILETGGSLSILLKGKELPLTVKDMGKAPNGGGINALIVSDGTVIEEGLRLSNTTEKQMKNELKKRELTLSEVFLMTANTSGSYLVIKREDTL